MPPLVKMYLSGHEGKLHAWSPQALVPSWHTYSCQCYYCRYTHAHSYTSTSKLAQRTQIVSFFSSWEKKIPEVNGPFFFFFCLLCKSQHIIALCHVNTLPLPFPAEREKEKKKRDTKKWRNSGEKKERAGEKKFSNMFSVALKGNVKKQKRERERRVFFSMRSCYNQLVLVVQSSTIYCLHEFPQYLMLSHFTYPW